MRKSIMVTNTN